jgi:hypothetical protein
MISLHIPILRVDSRALDNGQQIPLYTLCAHPFSILERSFSYCQLVNLINKNDSLFLYILDGLFLNVDLFVHFFHAVVVNGVKNVVNLLNLPCEGSLRWIRVIEFCQYFGFVGSGDKCNNLVVVMAFFEILKLLVYDLRIGDFITNHGV